MVMKWVRAILDALLPPKDDVRRAQSLREEEIADLFHPRLAGNASTVALFPYRDERIRAAIKSVKFYGEKSPLPMVGRIAGEYLMEVVSDKKLFAGWNIPLLVPIPLSQERFRERGYSQVERFAEHMLPFLNSAITYAPRALARQHRKSQVRVERASRGQNIAGAFFVPDPSLVKDTHIILLDDVVESGATMEDARRALRAAGARDVIGIAIAH